MPKKLIDRKDVLDDIVNVITPRYFPDITLDKSRVSIYGMFSEINARAIEDTISLEQTRSADYCPELSDSEIRVKQTAKLRDVEVAYAIPGQCFAMIGILKDDILKKGTRVGNEIRFVIDRRSTILYQGVNFSLEDDIIIRAVQVGSTYVYTVMYSGERASNTSYIQMYEQTDTAGQELIAMVCRIYQFNYNIQEKVVTDELAFLYDGIGYDYDNKLAGFEIYYRKSPNDTFTLLKHDHYLTTKTTKCIYFNDDESGILYVMNNAALGIPVNAGIRVEIKETLGTDGLVTIAESGADASFSLYKDSEYNYGGVNVLISMLTDVVGASDGATLNDIKRQLIDAKTRRNNITTEHDIISYIDNIDANIQLVKKRNDIEARIMNMYTLLRYGDNKIAPTTTKRLVLSGIQSDTDFGDFDEYEPTIGRRVVHAYNKFKLHVTAGTPDNDYVTKVPIDEAEEGAFYLTCPYMIMFDSNDIASYYFTSLDTTVPIVRQPSPDSFPFQLITHGLSFYRDSHSKDEPDTYILTARGIMNTSNDRELLDDTGKLLDSSCIVGYVVFNREGSPAAWMKLSISDYNPNSREFTLTGSMKTNDFITDQDTLHITDGLFHVGSDTPYDSVIDFTESRFQLYFLYKYDDVDKNYTRADPIYKLLPPTATTGYMNMCGYINPIEEPLDLILEFNKFSRSPCKVELEEADGDTYKYTLTEVPFMEFNFGVEWTHKLFETFKHNYFLYGNLLKLTSDFEVSLKFIATYGPSKYITVAGGRDENGDEVTVDLNNLNPQFRFRAYGRDLVVADIYDFIYTYLRDTYITGGSIFVSNICTAVENKFRNVRSIKYLGVDDLDASYQEFIYNIPPFVNRDVVTKYIPEQFNVTDIIVEIDET